MNVSEWAGRRLPMKSPEEAFLQWVYDRVEFDHGSGVKPFDQSRFSAICAIMHAAATVEYRKKKEDYENGQPAWGWRMSQHLTYLQKHAMDAGWSIEMVRQWIDNFFEPRRLVRYSDQSEVCRALSTKVNILVGKLKEETGGHTTSS